MSAQTYEFTAFTEASLLDAGDYNLNAGDCFTMPANANVCITVTDDDPFLSGDCYDQARDHTGQHAQIEGENGELGNGGQIYAESYLWVHDAHGNWYVLIEVEQEGTNDDYFTFYTGSGYSAPEPGTELTVWGKCNVSGNWVDYKCLDAGDKVDTGTISGTVFCDVDCDGINGGFEVIPGCDYTIEAEDMYGYGFQVVHGAQASGGELVKLYCAGGDGGLCKTFDGKDGVYDLKLRIQDESDGESLIKVMVNGHLVEAIRLDGYSTEQGSDDGDFSTFVIKDVALATGDDLSIAAWGDGYEFVRIDKIDLEGKDETVRTTEPPKDGVIVKLVNAQTGDVVATTITDPNGNYTFDDVPAGDYKVMGVAPDGTEFTIQDAGTDDSIDSDVDASGMSDVITVTKDSESTVDIGLKDLPELGSLSGRYFCDVNRDDLESADDTAVVGKTVTLFTAAGVEVGSTTTGTDGTYRFVDLEAGDYYVVFEDSLAESKEFVAQNAGSDDAVDSDVDTSGRSDTVTVVAGEETTDVDAGVVEQLGSLSGRYFCDVNRDDLESADDTAVVGKTVTLFTAAGVEVGSTTTGTDGTYRFVDLEAGDYYVVFEDSLTESKEFVAQNAGSDDAVDSDVDTSGRSDTVTVVAGEETTDVDAGVVDLPGSLSGRVFCDDNNNDVDDFEPGVDQVLVTLIGPDGTPTGDTVTTTSSGEYSFTGLIPGTYSVQFTYGGTKTLVDQNAGMDDAIDSDAADLGGGVFEITGIDVMAGQDTPDNDVGLEVVNDAPETLPDEGETCADEILVLDVLANDSDANGDVLTITEIDGIAITDGVPVTLGNGVIVTLTAGQLEFDGEAAFADLDIGEATRANFTYTVSDGTDSTSERIQITFKGDANTVASFEESLPAGLVEYQIRSGALEPFDADGFDLKFGETGDERFDNMVFEQAYCLSLFDPADGAATFDTAPILTANMSGVGDAPADLFNANQVSFANGNAAADNLDLVSWLLNQDYESQGFSGWEVQRAIWELTDSLDTDFQSDIDPLFGDDADVDFLVAEALANGENFVAGVGDIVGVIVDPNPVTGANSQPFIVAVQFEDVDCICGGDDFIFV